MRHYSNSCDDLLSALVARPIVLTACAASEVYRKFEFVNKSAANSIATAPYGASQSRESRGLAASKTLAA